MYTFGQNKMKEEFWLRVILQILRKFDLAFDLNIILVICQNEYQSIELNGKYMYLSYHYRSYF